MSGLKIKILISIVVLASAVIAITTFRQPQKSKSTSQTHDWQVNQNNAASTEGVTKPQTASLPDLAAQRASTIDVSKVNHYLFVHGQGGSHNPTSTNLQLAAFSQPATDNFTTILSNAIAQLPEITKDFPNQALALRILGTSLDKSIIIIDPYNPTTYESKKVLYSYQIRSGIVHRLTLSEELYASFDNNGYSNWVFVKNKDTILFAPNRQHEQGKNQQLYLVNIFKDTKQLFKQFEGNDTLNAGSYSAPIFDMTPAEVGKARIAVFDQSLKNSNYDPSRDKGRTIVKTFYDYTLP